MGKGLSRQFIAPIAIASAIVMSMDKSRRSYLNFERNEPQHSIKVHKRTKPSKKHKRR